MSSVFNSSKSDYEVGKLFLGQARGLVDSVHCHFPKLNELYLKQKSLDWSHLEFDFSSCLADFKRCDKSTYEIMIKTLSWQWEADSVVANNIAPVVAPFVTNTELWSGWLEITKIENTHALTYSEMARCSFDDPSVVLDEILKTKEALSRMSTIVSIMDKAYDTSHKYALGIVDDGADTYNDIFMFVVALLMLERLQFIVSFAITFSVAESGYFLPFAMAVKKIAQDEIEIHAEFDKEILNIELGTDRGLMAFNRNKDKIRAALDEVVKSEVEWTNYLFSEGRSLVGMTEELIYKWIHFNAQELYDFFGFDLPFERVTRNPLPFMNSWLPGSEQQNSPQEEVSTDYLVGAVLNDVGDGKLNFKL
jgi:ribonucleoside-diphosphate reductase beta chain